MLESILMKIGMIAVAVLVLVSPAFAQAQEHPTPQLTELTQVMDAKFRSVIVQARGLYQKDCLTVGVQTQISTEGSLIRLLCKKTENTSRQLEVIYSFERNIESGAVELSPGTYRLEAEKSSTPSSLTTLANLDEQESFVDHDGNEMKGKVLKNLIYDMAKDGVGVFFAVKLSDQVYPIQYDHDKRKHAAVGSLIAGFTTGMLNLQLKRQGKLKPITRVWTALSGLAFGFVVAYGKEVFDSTQPHNRFDKDDVKMTTYGAAVGASMVSIPIDEIVQAIRRARHQKRH